MYMWVNTDVKTVYINLHNVTFVVIGVSYAHCNLDTIPATDLTQNITWIDFRQSTCPYSQGSAFWVYSESHFRGSTIFRPYVWLELALEIEITLINVEQKMKDCRTLDTVRTKLQSATCTRLSNLKHCKLFESDIKVTEPTVWLLSC